MARPCRPVRLLLAGSFVALVAGCGWPPEPPRTISVEFEIVLVNAQATVYAAGLSSGGALAGYGAVNETIRHSVYARIGEPVFCEVLGQQWNRAEPGHQVLCRITVDGEEIYLCGDQGTPDEDSKAECGGPAYVPEKGKED